MSGPVITAAGLRFAYGSRNVLEQVDLSVGAGEIFGVVGADGAGKSTLLRLMIGQLAPMQGRISVLGMPPTDARLRQNIAYMPQSFGQYADLSVQENLEFFADLHGLDRASARPLIRDLLGRTGLRGFETRRAAQLSGGMMQKLALACALVSHPRAMFLDEPTTGVDPVSRRAFWQLLDAVRAQGVAILYTTANMDEAERCDRVGLLQDGRMSRQGAPLELMKRVQTPLYAVAGEDARAWRRQVRALPAIRLAFPIGRQIKVWLADGFGEADLRAQVAAVAPHLRVAKLEPSLQDVALHDLARTEGGVHA
jgi:ABC-2 type transport system ATP-binding protein